MTSEQLHETRMTAHTYERTAVLVPCYNEERTVGDVVRGFQAALPGATIYVYDNNSKDRTIEIARAAGAVVRSETRQGKGEVMRRMFADIEAETYVLVDGDATYDAPSAPELIRTLSEGPYDMVTGARREVHQAAYRPGHRFGNRVLTGMVASLFGHQSRDMLSGYRVFSRRFVKSFPALSSGFEIETELTIHALSLRLPIVDVDTPYGNRPEGSVSKLATYKDGLRILRTIIVLLKEEKPLQFFSSIALAMVVVAGVFFVPVFQEYARTGLVPRFPTLIVSVSLGLAGLLSFACGMILDSVARGRRENKRLAYLSLPAPVAQAVVNARVAVAATQAAEPEAAAQTDGATREEVPIPAAAEAGRASHPS